MKTTKRFENAVMKLYNAFHSGELDFIDCKKCAVGNICNGSSAWFQLFPSSPLHNLARINYGNYKGFVKEIIDETGYSPKELQYVEALFGNEEENFEGLCAVVEYLAALDSIPNPMNYTRLFETENDKPKYELWK